MSRPPRREPGSLIGTGVHAVHRLAPDLLLVFKPAGHREEQHVHPHRQTLRVLRGALLVRTARRDVVLRPRAGTLTLAAGRRHATEALDDTWLIAESTRGAKRPLPSRRARS